MIKLKVNDRPNYISCTLKQNKISLLENIVLLDVISDNIKEYYGLTDKEINKNLLDYRANLKKENEVI